jgi:beta-alanine degradation protein BauB
LRRQDVPGDWTGRDRLDPTAIWSFRLAALRSFCSSSTYRETISKRNHFEFKAGEIVWMNSQSHIGENIGDTDTHVLITELKELPGKKAVETDVPKRTK